jgi:(R,R)-butanediol dehydrogenase/meso-butanediol dehydrogenase/diacetyl reductase
LRVRAALWHGRRDVRIEEIPEPRPGAGEALVRVAWCGICGTDLHEYTHGPLYLPTRPHPLTGKAPPIVLGHEFAGEVVAVGPEAPRDLVGQRVTANVCLFCRECTFCRRGLFNLCGKLGSIGLSADGAFARYVVVPAYTLHRLPAGVPDEAGALCEPLAVAIHAARLGGVRLGETVGIVGAGPIGLLVLQVVRAAGAADAYVIEPVPGRAARAADLGATAVFDPAADVAREVARRTDELRLDVAFECAGSQEALALCQRITRRGGRIVQVGIPLAPVAVDLTRLIMHEKRLIGSNGYLDEFPSAIGLLARGAVRVDRMVTARIGLARLLDEGFAALQERPGDHVKILVSPE